MNRPNRGCVRDTRTLVRSADWGSKNRLSLQAEACADGIEDVISAASTLDATVGRILRDTGLPVPGIVARLCRLAKGSRCSGTATIACVEMRAFDTADQAAGSAVAMIEDGERLSGLWRYRD
jgi:hypothetical protein